MYNHAILIQAHAYPELIKLIIDRLSAENHYFFIHIDSKTKDYEAFLRLATDHVIFAPHRYNVKWGAVEQIYLTIELLKMALSYKINFDYYHLISGQDYPHYKAEEFDNIFKNNTCSYMEIDDNNNFENRYMYYHTNSILSIRSKWGRRLENTMMKIQILYNKFFRLRKPLQLRPYKGSNWWSLHNDAVHYIIDYIMNNPSYLKRFRFTNCCDEIFFHTILLNSKLRDTIYQHDLRYVDWKKKNEGDKLPRILTIDDYEAIKKSKTVFIRKIDLSLSKSLLNMLK